MATTPDRAGLLEQYEMIEDGWQREQPDDWLRKSDGAGEHRREWHDH